VDRTDEAALRCRKQTETFPMSAKKFELKKFTREEWLVMDKRHHTLQLIGHGKKGEYHHLRYSDLPKLTMVTFRRS
jgi:hypothetical protein